MKHTFSNSFSNPGWKINWKCFPNLEVLELYVYDVNTDGIKKFCKKLTKFNTKIDTLAD